MGKVFYKLDETEDGRTIFDHMIWCGSCKEVGEDTFFRLDENSEDSETPYKVVCLSCNEEYVYDWILKRNCKYKLRETVRVVDTTPIEVEFTYEKDT